MLANVSEYELIQAEVKGNQHLISLKYGFG